MMLVFDSTERESFVQLSSHVERLHPQFIVATKIDLSSKRVVSEEEARNLANSVAGENCQYFEARIIRRTTNSLQFS